ncbi:MAG: phosphatidate cytidylyltransferase [Pseudomonadales bacterium]|nr:phosphatidate cytidylyltransferase [Pseudomonadales bacterium]MDP6471703.1 phosphatidate cytidylyltransferase [Pseudomonadales bacterium]MDP6970052.1 phosphatidate cytidylyltransferase [Pseudomonadales bacterium]
MFKQRVITAACLAPLAVVAIYFLSLPWFAFLIALVAAIGVYEWSAFAALRGQAARLAYVAVWAVLVWFTWDNPELVRIALWASLALWIGALCAVLAYPSSERVLHNPVIAGVLGILVLWCAWTAVVALRDLPQGANWLLWGFVLVWGADIGAYFAGRVFGNVKLAPRVSPGKTWEGVAGGFVLAGVVCGAALTWAGWLSLPWVVIFVVLVAVSVLGDLFESAMKRTAHVKDSGSLLPGHGGVLDRIDAMVAVMPVLALVLSDEGLALAFE